MNIPNRVFFTGAPGSRWSGTAQIIEQIYQFNTSDRTPEREYLHSSYSGHKGAYFGRMMEMEAKLDPEYIDSAWRVQGGTRLVKSHDWAYCLPKIKQAFPDDWIMLVWRENQACFDWWKEAGGFDIKYPSYGSYRNDDNMKKEIDWQNQSIQKFALENNLQWSLFDTEWIWNTFDVLIEVDKVHPDVWVAVLK
jgi:hypothetical protein